MSVNVVNGFKENKNNGFNGQVSFEGKNRKTEKKN